MNGKLEANYCSLLALIAVIRHVWAHSLQKLLAQAALRAERDNHAREVVSQRARHEHITWAYSTCLLVSYATLGLRLDLLNISIAASISPSFDPVAEPTLGSLLKHRAQAD